MSQAPNLTRAHASERSATIATSLYEIAIDVTAQQFAWRFDYVDQGKTSTELHVPSGTQLELHLQALDVLHSFWVPEWRVKRDLVPGDLPAVPGHEPRRHRTRRGRGDRLAQEGRMAGGEGREPGREVAVPVDVSRDPERGRFLVAIPRGSG